MRCNNRLSVCKSESEITGYCIASVNYKFPPKLKCFHIKNICFNQCSQICSPFDKNHFPSERRKRVETKKLDEIKIKDIESKHKIS